MEKWKVKTIETVFEFTKEGTILNRGLSTVEVEADWVESFRNTLVFWRWSDEKKSKKSAVAVFSIRNIISAIKEEPTNA